MLQLIVYATQPLGLHGQTVQSTYPQESLCPKYLSFQSLSLLINTCYSTYLESITLVSARIFVLQSYLPNSQQNFPVTCHEMSDNCW